MKLFWKRGSKSPAKNAEKNASRRKFGKTNKKISADATLFAPSRNPCRIPGGKSCHPCCYPAYNKGKESFGFLIQCLSDRNYAMRSYCLDDCGAKYNTFKKPNNKSASVVWFPKTNLNDHSNDGTIIDGCHLGLIDPDDGFPYLTGENLEMAIVNAGEPIECVFLNGTQSAASAQMNPEDTLSADDIASSISKCSETLFCISLTECRVNASVIDAIASCSELRGIILENCDLCGACTDAKLAAMLRACKQLRWCFVKSPVFGKECWDALATADTCPDLEVLWVDAPRNSADWTDCARGNLDTIRSALDGRAGKIKLCMINPCEEGKSRYVIGGSPKTDRLNGTKRTGAETLMYLTTGYP